LERKLQTAGMLLGFLNYLVFDCGMSVVLIKNDDDDDAFAWQHFNMFIILSAF